MKFKKNPLKVPLLVKTATHKLDYVLCILHYSAPGLLVNFLHLAIVEDKATIVS